MISRRQFLIGSAGAAAGLILPDWVVRAERFIETEDAPLLEVPTIARAKVNAVFLDGIDDIRLVIGNPYEEPPRLTWFQYFDRYYGDEYESFEEFVARYGSKTFNPDYTVDDVRRPAVREAFERLGAPEYRFESPKMMMWLEGLRTGEA